MKTTASVFASHINKTFGTNQAVSDVSLDVQPGEIYGLVGPDGAGKTTVLRLLCGALHTDTNKLNPAVIQVAGYDVLRQTDQARACIGYLPQRFSLYEDLTVMENIRFFAEVRGIPSSEWRPRCNAILEFVGLGEFHHRRAGHLSGGMKQKLGLAAALVHQPSILLLDEPTTGVDPVTRQDFWQLIIRLVTQAREGSAGTCVIVSTPYMDEAARCARVGFMRDSRLIVEGTPGELREILTDRILELAGIPLALLRDLARNEPMVENVQRFGDRLHLRIRKGESDLVLTVLSERIAAEGGQVTRFESVPPQLEDVFMSLVEEKD